MFYDLCLFPLRQRLHDVSNPTTLLLLLSLLSVLLLRWRRWLVISRGRNLLLRLTQQSGQSCRASERAKGGCLGVRSSVGLLLLRLGGCVSVLRLLLPGKHTSQVADLRLLLVCGLLRLRRCLTLLKGEEKLLEGGGIHALK
jgi:hypothetical protein